MSVCVFLCVCVCVCARLCTSERETKPGKVSEKGFCRDIQHCVNFLLIKVCLRDQQHQHHLEMMIKNFWASLVAQWLRICLLMQGTRVRALVWEDPTCRGAAGPVSHNC